MKEGGGELTVVTVVALTICRHACWPRVKSASKMRQVKMRHHRRTLTRIDAYIAGLVFFSWIRYQICTFYVAIHYTK